jgi:hypothetical protein
MSTGRTLRSTPSTTPNGHRSMPPVQNDELHDCLRASSIAGNTNGRPFATVKWSRSHLLTRRCGLAKYVQDILRRSVALDPSRSRTGQCSSYFVSLGFAPELDEPWRGGGSIDVRLK